MHSRQLLDRQSITPNVLKDLMRRISTTERIPWEVNSKGRIRIYSHGGSYGGKTKLCPVTGVVRLLSGVSWQVDNWRHAANWLESWGDDEYFTRHQAKLAMKAADSRGWPSRERRQYRKAMLEVVNEGLEESWRKES